MRPVPPRSLEAALAHLRNGGELLVPSYTRPRLLTGEVLAKFEKAGQWLLKEDGDGYRLRVGKRSEYLYPGCLCFYSEVG